MTSNIDKDKELLKELLRCESKHSNYQVLHPSLSILLDKEYKSAGRCEVERLDYIKKITDFENKKVIDIGSNTGYFSFSAVELGAAAVTSYEGDEEHAAFVENAAEYLRLSDKIIVKNKYFDFENAQTEVYDIGLCLNVLHHLGDDFDDTRVTLEEAKSKILNSLNNLSGTCKCLWFQLGFNWKGNPGTPLFKNGLKIELIEYIRGSVSEKWSIKKIAVYNPDIQEYQDLTSKLLSRFDLIGEFRNRPLFLLESKCKG